MHLNTKHIFLLLSTLIFTSSLFAQSIEGTAVDEKGAPIIGGNVVLMKATDSSEVKYSITDADGKYIFTEIAPDQYIIRITDLSIGTAYSDQINYDGSKIQMSDVIIQQSSQKLNEIVITYERPIMEMKADRLVFNVDSTANSVGLSAMELMRKAPGVLVDKDDNISLSGKNGVVVYIDNKPTPLSGTELAEFLKGIQSNSIDAIDIITNPSAKYEASGNAGIINIRLKKDKKIGTNGSVNAGFAYGKYPKYNGGFALNHRSKNWNVYGNYNINLGNKWNEVNFERSLLDTFYNKKMLMNTKFQSHNFKAGADYFINNKSTVGIMINGNVNDNFTKLDSRTDIIDMTTNKLVKYLRSDNEQDELRVNSNANLNYQYNDKQSDKSLNLDLDYGTYTNISDIFQPNVFYNPENEIIQVNDYKINSPKTIEISSIKADWEQNALKGKLGLGAKISFINTNNDYEFYNLDTLWMIDRERSNKFNYYENIQAAYAMYSRQLNGFALQAGLRSERTVSKGVTSGERKNTSGGFEAYDSTFRKPYIDFFPSFGITYNKNPMNQLSFNYSRRIDRPNYQYLNPFEMKLDEYSYRKGNVNLQPQYTNSFSLIHTYKYRFITKLDYSHVSNMFAEFIDTMDANKLIQTNKNLATQDIVSLNFSLPVQYKKWSMFANLNTYYSIYKANFGPGKVIDQDVFSFNGYMQHTYKFNSWLSGEVSGWYTAPSVWMGVFKSIAMGGVDIGAQATVLKGKGQIKASMGDIFNTMKWGGRSDFVGQKVFAYGRWESQQFRLNFTYRFGNSEAKIRQRKTGVEAEAQRTGSSEGLGEAR